MAVYAIADLHLPARQKPMDVFGEHWRDHFRRIREDWLTRVAPGDLVLLPGDLSWAMRLEDAAEDLRSIAALPGTKLLLRGNHDYWWTTKRKMDAFLQDNSLHTISILFNNAYRVGDCTVCGTRGWMLENDSPEDVKVINREAGRLRMSLDEAVKLGGEIVAFLHYPPYYRGIECAEIMDVLLEYGVKKCYYGHIHGKKNFRLAHEGDYKGIDFRLISCDKVSFMPYLVR